MYSETNDPLGPTAGLMIGAAVAAGRQLRQQDRTIGHLDGLVDEKNIELRRQRAHIQELERQIARSERETAALRERVAYLEGLNAQARSHIVETARERDEVKLHVAFYRAQFEGAQAIVRVLMDRNPDLAGMSASDSSEQAPVVTAFVEAFDAEVVRAGYPHLQGYSVPKMTTRSVPVDAPLPRIKLTPVPAAIDGTLRPVA